MPNNYFRFKKFIIQQDRCAMKVTTDGCLFGAWVSEKVRSEGLKVKSVADIGAGTGLLSLMLVQKNPEILIDTIEIDNESFEQATGNITASLWKDRVTVIHADVKKFAPEKKYDLIISNPPFYENELKSENQKKNVAHHSNDLSLNDLFIITKNLLTDSGKFFFLFPYKRKKEIEQALNKHDFFADEIILVRQLIQHDFFRFMIRGGIKETGEIKVREISIRNDKQEYTEEFTALLKDYYLYL
jgi:tRNA1Val (adenine37-N6)-methyltransferase